MAGWSFEVRVRRIGDDVVVVSVSGEIDIATVASFSGALKPTYTNPTVRLVVCDLSEVSFFGCTGVSVLLSAHSRLRARGAWLRVVAHGNAVLRTLSVTGVLERLTVSPDVRSALG